MQDLATGRKMFCINTTVVLKCYNYGGNIGNIMQNMTNCGKYGERKY